jgi:hypothetical protein
MRRCVAAPTEVRISLKHRQIGFKLYDITGPRTVSQAEISDPSGTCFLPAQEAES